MQNMQKRLSSEKIVSRQNKYKKTTTIVPVATVAVQSKKSGVQLICTDRNEI